VGPHVHEVKKSRFVAYGARASSTAEAHEFVRVVAAHESKASHVCWACVCADGDRAMDDGEPSGTAGRPILNAIQGEGLHEVIVAVARYRNGPKLGAGGLLRAYGAAARLLVALADQEGQLETIVPTSSVVISAPVSNVGNLYALGGTQASDGNRVVCDVSHDEFVGSEVRVTFAVAQGFEDDLVALAREATAGAARRIDPR
jgi:hypothetical protein